MSTAIQAAAIRPNPALAADPTARGGPPPDHHSSDREGRCRQSISRRPLPLLRPRRSPLPRTSVEADFAVELGADDETLEFPWAADDGGPRYCDLKRQPELLLNVEEAGRVPELAEFLAAMNSPAGILETAKCDTWSSTEINPEEEIFGAAYKVLLLRGHPVFAGGCALLFCRA